MTPPEPSEAQGAVVDRTPQPSGDATGRPTHESSASLAILVVESSLRDNGGLRVSLEYARQWRVAGAPASVAVLQDVDDGPTARPDPALDVSFMSPRRRRFRYAWPLALARLVFKARRVDIVVSGSEIGICLLFGYAAARLARRPFAVLVQADLDDAIETWVAGPLRRITRWAHAHSDAAVCVTQSLVPGVVANGLPQSRAHVVVNGVDVAGVREQAGLGEITERGVASRAGSNDSHYGLPTVVGHGRLSPQKDFGLLVRAHLRVRAAGVEHRLVIIGEGPAREELEALITELGVDDSVELPGFVDNPHAHKSTADLFVLSSRSEGMPLTLLEALAVGAPIISTRCGTGPDLLLAEGTYGELVPVGSVDALAAAIERHLRDPEPLMERARGGPERALAFDVGKSSRTIMEILTGLSRPGRRGTTGKRSPSPAHL